MNTKNTDIAQTLPIELRAHLYQKLEDLRAYLIPGVEIDVKINPQAKEGFAIEFIVRADNFELKTSAAGENAFKVTTEASDDLIEKLRSTQSQISEILEQSLKIPYGQTIH